MYAFHREHFDPLYSDYVIYSPAVPVFRDDSGQLLEEPYTLGIVDSWEDRRTIGPFGEVFG
jgi:uncharacterized protein (TIGR02452 family)